MYILSIKRVKNTFGKPLDTPEWEYAGYDNFSGSFSTGYPIFTGLYHASRFSTVDEAKDWYTRNKDYIYDGMNQYDLSTLAVRKIIFKTVEKIDMERETK